MLLLLPILEVPPLARSAFADQPESSRPAYFPESITKKPFPWVRFLMCMGRDFYKDTYEVISKLNVLLPKSRRMALPAEPLPFDQWNSNSNINWTATRVYLNQGDDGSEEQTEDESE